MSPPDRQPVSDPPPSAAPLPAALRPDGRAPRSRAERLLMLCTLAAISLAVAIPTLVITRLFGQRPRPKPPMVAAQTTPAPGDGLRAMLEKNATTAFPTPAALTPDPITITVRPGNVAARAETVVRQAAQFGGVATEGLPEGNERHLWVDLPVAQTAAFRQAVNKPNDPATHPIPSPALTPGEGQDHVEIIIRPAGNDE